MNRTQVLISLFVLVTVVFGASREGLAQCPDAIDAVLLFPSNRARDVPPNLILRAEFPPTRNPGGEPTWIVLDPSGRRVEGTSAWDGLTTTFTPAVELAERAVYSARVTASGRGEYWDISFMTGAETDQSPPTFGGLRGLSFAHKTQDWLRDQCNLARSDAFLFYLNVPSPQDDVAPDQLCYYVYQTRGPGDSGLVARLRSEDENEIVLVHSLDEGEGEFCFRVEVRDLMGNYDGNRREQCVEAIVGAIYSDACSMTGRPGQHDISWFAIVLALILVACGRRKIS